MKYYFLLVYHKHKKKKKKDDEEEEDWHKHWKNLTNTSKTKISEGYDLFLEPCSDANWCEPTQPTIKIEIWSWKAKKDMIGVKHNKNLSQGTNTIGMKSNDATKSVNLW
jgi:hypothetical protein